VYRNQEAEGVSSSARMAHLMLEANPGQALTSLTRLGSAWAKPEITAPDYAAPGEGMFPKPLSPLAFAGSGPNPSVILSAARRSRHRSATGSYSQPGENPTAIFQYPFALYIGSWKRWLACATPAIPRMSTGGSRLA
jgi:hypothetical protein